MFIKQLELGPMANYVYLVGDAATKECAVVDPAWDVPSIREAAAEAGLSVTMALVTHNHPDHTNGIGELLESCDIPVYAHKDDAFALAGLGGALRTVSGGEKVPLGSLEITFLHTPGHTEGSQCFLIRDQLLTGDTLFVRGCGRVDLPGSDPEKMYHSLRKLCRLKGSTLVYPGHNYSREKNVRLDVERGQNPYIRACLAVSPREFRELVGF